MVTLEMFPIFGASLIFISDNNIPFYCNNIFIGAIVANLSIFIHEHKRKGAVSAHLIANNEARDKFVLSDAGLLMTSQALDREERDTYMVTTVIGRKGILRGKQAIQVKVTRRQNSIGACHFTN